MHSYLLPCCMTFNISTIADKTNVIALAIMTGILRISMPYISQNATPSVNKAYMGSEMPDKSRVRQDL